MSWLSHGTLFLLALVACDKGTISQNPAPTAASSAVVDAAPSSYPLSSEVVRAKLAALDRMTRREQLAPDGGRALPRVGPDIFLPDPQRKPAPRVLYDDLASSVTAGDVKVLLHHENPAIRVYFIRYVSEHMPNDTVALVAPLATDRAQCTYEEWTLSVGENAVGYLFPTGLPKLPDGGVDAAAEHREYAALAPLYARFARSDDVPDDARDTALRMLTKGDPKTAREIAHAFEGSSNEVLKKSGVEVLGFLRDD